MAQTFSVMGAVREAIAFWRMTVPKVWGALAVLLVLAVALQMLTLSRTQPLLTIAVGLASIFASALAQAAVLRNFFAGEHPGNSDFQTGPAGLQWGRTEWRLIGATFLLGFFFVLVALGVVFLIALTAIAFSAAAGAVATGAGFIGSPAGIAVVLIGVVSLIGVIWCSIRLALFMAATVDRQRVQVFSTWTMTRGVVLRIFAAGVLCYIPALLMLLLTTGVRLASRSAGTAPDAISVGLGVLSALVTVVIETPLLTGLYAVIYRLLRDRDGAVTASAL